MVIHDLWCLIACFAVLADAVTTIAAFKMFPESTVEKNEILKKVMDKFGIVPAVLISHIAVVIFLSYFKDDLSNWFYMAVAGGFIAISLWNVVQIVEAKYK